MPSEFRATRQSGSRQPFRAGLDGALLKLQGMAPTPETRLAQDLGGVFDGWSRGVKDYTPFQDIILQLVEAIVATRWILGFGPDRPRHAAAVACLLLCYPLVDSLFHGLTELGLAFPGPRCSPTREIDKKA